MPTFAFTRTVKSFQKQLVLLDVAVSACIASQKKEPVHRLRTATRRVEAELTLLEILQVLPSDSTEASALRKRLKKIRRAAGMVRDLDVQLELTHRDNPAAAELHNFSDQTRHAAGKLRKHLQQQREHEALKLARVLRREGRKLEFAQENLQRILRLSKSSSVTMEQLTTRIESWFYAATREGHQSIPMRPGTGNHSDDLRAIKKLHKLRKAAKLCRYMAESLRSRSLAIKLLAKRFEAIQEAGGRWHDWLLLEEIAARHTEKHGELTKRYAEQRDVSLANYRLQLADLLPT